MPRQSELKRNGTSSKKINPLIIIAVITLIGTLTTAILTSPLLMALILKTPLPTITSTETLAPSPTLTQTATITLATDTPPEVGLCSSGQPISVKIPIGPANFDNQFGYTLYNTNNSRELALNAIRALLAYDNGLWVGYGAISNVGLSGVSFVSNNLGGNRSWEYCTSTEGKPIGHLSNALAKGNDNTLWVATDGDGVWRLQGGKWEQFVYDPQANDYEPNSATYALAASDTNMLVGDGDGITRWTGATWDRVLFNKKVGALAVGAQGEVKYGSATSTKA